MISLREEVTSQVKEVPSHKKEEPNLTCHQGKKVNNQEKEVISQME